MISVCMATYNGRQYILRQLQSIITQLGVDDEIIIVDDNSTDDTVDLVRQLNDQRIKIYCNEYNLGVNKTFERAILKASGEIIFLSDQDDIWMPNKVSHVLTVFSLNPEVFLIHHDAKVVDDKLNIIDGSFYHWRKYIRKEWFFNIIRDTHLGCCMAFRKEIIKEVTPITTRPYHDRWIGIIASLKHYDAKYISEKLIYYIRHKDTTTSTILHRRSLINILKDRFLLLKDIVKLMSN